MDKDQNKKGEHINYLWDKISLSDRLNMVLNYAEDFLVAGLIYPTELVAAAGLPLHEWDYILHREQQPLFSRLHLKENVLSQNMRQQLRTVLKKIYN